LTGSIIISIYRKISSWVTPQKPFYPEARLRFTEYAGKLFHTRRHVTSHPIVFFLSHRSLSPWGGGAGHARPAVHVRSSTPGGRLQFRGKECTQQRHLLAPLSKFQRSIVFVLYQCMRVSIVFGSVLWRSKLMAVTSTRFRTI
jgi:hypothetical protein